MSPEKRQPHARANAREQRREAAALAPGGGQSSSPRARSPVMSAAPPAGRALGTRTSRPPRAPERAPPLAEGFCVPEGQPGRPITLPPGRDGKVASARLRRPQPDPLPACAAARDPPAGFSCSESANSAAAGCAARTPGPRTPDPGTPVPPPGASLTSDADARQRPQHQRSGPERPRSHLVRRRHAPPRLRPPARPSRLFPQLEGRGGDAVGGTQRGGTRTRASSPRALFWTLSPRGGGGKTAPSLPPPRSAGEASLGPDVDRGHSTSSAHILVPGSTPMSSVCLETPSACGPPPDLVPPPQKHPRGPFHLRCTSLCTLSITHSHFNSFN